MAGKPGITRTLVMTGSPVVLGTDEEILDCNVGAPPANASNVTLTDIDGGTAILQPGAWWPFKNLRLSTLTVTGAVGTTVNIFGQASE